MKLKQATIIATLIIGLSKINAFAVNATNLWSFTTGGEIQSSPALATDGTIYFGSTDGSLYALNPNGTLRWQYATGGEIHSSPSVAADGTIYVGSYDSLLYAINPNGTLKWSVKPTIFATQIFSSPAIAADGRIYVGTDIQLASLNPDGTTNWSVFMNGDGNSSPAIGLDGTIYMADPGNHLFAFNTNGTMKWQASGALPLHSSPAIGGDGAIYFGGQNAFYCVNTNGTVRWTNAVLGDVNASPVVIASGRIYVEIPQGLRAVNANGTTAWTATGIGSVPFSAPAITASGNIIAASGENGLIYAFNSSGTQLWQFQTGGATYSSPVVAPNGTIYVGSYDGNLYAIQNSSGPAASSNPWPMFHNNSLHTGQVPKPIVSLSVPDAAAAEPTATGTFRVTRAGVLTLPLTVSYSVDAASTATSGTDYHTLSNSVTIAAGAATADIIITPIDDTAYEGSETVILDLTPSAAYDLGATTNGTVTIADNDKPTVTIANSGDAQEPDVAGSFTVSRTGFTGAPLTVFYTRTGTATSGVDFTALPTSVTIPAGSSSAVIPVTPIDDLTAESTETVILTITVNAAYTKGTPGAATVNILDND